MPRTVLWSLVAQALSLIWGTQRFLSALLSGPPVLFTLPLLCGLAFPAVLLFAMACRRNWARIAWVILYVLDSATEPLRTWILSRHGASAAAPEFQVADATLVLVDVVALALVFLPSSSRWFTSAVGNHAGQQPTASA